MKLLPFDLQKALAGAKVVTRDRREVKGLRDMREFGYKGSHPLSGVVGERVCSWTLDGVALNIFLEHHNDLFLAAPEPERRTLYLYEAKDGEFAVRTYISLLKTSREWCEMVITQERRDGKWVTLSDEEAAR